MEQQISVDTKKFEFPATWKRTTFILMALGIVGILLGLYHGVMHPESHYSRLWSNVLLNTYYFTGISLVGLFFVASHQLGYSGWQTIFKRIPIAMGRFLIVSLVLAILIIVGLVTDLHHLYGHWTVHTDAIIEGKKPFLTKPFYSIAVFIYFTLWALFSVLIARHFWNVKNWKEYKKTKAISAAFLVVFGVTTSMVSWHFVMSLDPHWYSTLFGWYNFSSYACGGFAMIILFLIGLKQVGYLPNVNVNHIHDLGKYLFGFSVFWAYLWFSQFLLIWYANIPEATVFYAKRFDEPLFKGIFFVAFLINFLLPLLVLMKRDSKRKLLTMAFVSVVLIGGHYLDFYQMIMLEPNAVIEHHEGEEHHGEHATVNEVESAVLYADAHGDVHVDDEHAIADAHHSEEGMHGHGERTTYAGIGIIELFIFCGFLGLFLYLVFQRLDNEELEVQEDPFLKESIIHHI